MQFRELLSHPVVAGEPSAFGQRLKGVETGAAGNRHGRSVGTVLIPVGPSGVATRAGVRNHDRHLLGHGDSLPTGPGRRSGANYAEAVSIAWASSVAERSRPSVDGDWCATISSSASAVRAKPSR